jgi:hypothetical protein
MIDGALILSASRANHNIKKTERQRARRTLPFLVPKRCECVLPDQVQAAQKRWMRSQASVSASVEVA